MKRFKLFVLLTSVVVAMCSCTDYDTPPNKVQYASDGGVIYKVVAHRGGYLECLRPACSVAALKYAIYLRCYASECDIVLTKDNDVMVVHPTSGYLVNGLEPFNHTVEEIRAAGTLTNGEEIPTLRDFINVLQDSEQNPYGLKVWLDVKRLTKNDKEIDVNYTINACYRACEIIKEMHAQNLCEFLIPTGTDIFNTVKDTVIDEYKINLAWMTCTNPDKYGKAWAQLAYAKIFGENTTYGPLDYITAEVPLSVYNVDDDESMDAVIPYYPKLKAIFTNYPSKLIQKLKTKGLVE
jgi:glycerophosphoryl diester phosphodiesterase